MPKVSDKSKFIFKNGMGLQSECEPIRTVIAVTPPPLQQQSSILEVETDPDHVSKTVVGRSLSNRSSNVKGGKKLGHRRVGDDGEVTYKKFETTQLIGSIQLGLEYILTNEANLIERDLLLTVSVLISEQRRKR